jgi:hypothetical protein
MGAMLAALTGLIRSRSARADWRRMQGIGGGDAGRKTRPDRRKYLHHQGNQNDWKKFLQPPAHRNLNLFEVAT